jgi:1D-myo-inositol-tetrakisphosphate 5-kinase/inositol-polyphosphate multikinase
MPTYVGSLHQHENSDEIAPLLERGEGVVPVTTTTIPQDGMEIPSGAAVVGALNGNADSNPAAWKPSGGKKLSTGLAIVLENVTAGFKRPNVLDVKLGARLWDDDAPESKRRKLDEVAEQTTSGSLGFRVAGMKLFVGEDKHRLVAQQQEQSDSSVVEFKNGYKSYNKNYGRGFTKENVTDAFTTYFGGVEEDSGPRSRKFKHNHGRLLARRMLRELESIQYVLENQESRMYSASVLMVYEGDEEALEVGLAEEAKQQEDVEGEGSEDEDEDEDDDDDTVPQKVHEVRLIDFAHAKWTPGQGPDENALQGVRSVISIMRQLVA